MNRDDIIRMAIDAHLLNYVDNETPRRYFICADADVEEVERFAALVAAAEKELIAQWVESWGNDLTIKEIVEGIRTDGNGATRPLKYVTRDSGEELT